MLTDREIKEQARALLDYFSKDAHDTLYDAFEFWANGKDFCFHERCAILTKAIDLFKAEDREGNAAFKLAERGSGGYQR